MINLKVPTDLLPFQGEFCVRHRFYGKFTDKPFENFFGMNQGANVGMDFRFSPLKRIEINSMYIFEYNEYILGCGYTFDIPEVYLKTQFNIHLFSFKPVFDVPDRKTGSYVQVVIQTNPIIQRLQPVINMGYDSYLKKSGIGFGFDLILIKKFHFIGEIFHNNNSQHYLTKKSYAFGFKLLTYGHRFVILLGNNNDIGVRRLVQGTKSNNLFLGFSIHRIIEF
jgi:hypothetical protein